MLHEILLSLSGHPSPLLRTAAATASHGGSSSDGGAPDPTSDLITPPERELLAGIAHLSDLHVKLLSFSAQIAASHPSTICRAVATAIDGTHLAAFQRKVLEVEEGILRKDAGLVGAYNIVPLAAIVVEFEGWTRRLEWLWEMVEFMLSKKERADNGQENVACTGARVINRLRAELQTGYQDIEETARNLVRVAETAWVKQVSSWILYGRLPGFGAEDFFIQKSEMDEVSAKSQHYNDSSKLTPSSGIRLRSEPFAVVRVGTNVGLDALHWTVSEPYQGKEQSRRRHARPGPSLIATQGIIAVDLSS